MNIEDYILLRKNKDKLDEHDLNNKMNNMQILIGYIFDYYNLPEEEIKSNKINKVVLYQKELSYLSDDTRRWLIEIFSKYNVKLDKELSNLLDKNIYFLLNNSETSFSRVSYDIYSKLVVRKKYSFIEEYPLEVLSFMKEYHKLKSNNYRSSISKYGLNLTKKEKIKIQIINKMFNINLIEWIKNYEIIFSKNKSLWSLKHKKYIMLDNNVKECVYDYKYNRNLFELSTVLKKTQNEILKERKLIEKIMMYFWTKDIANDLTYYKEYCKKNK